MIVKAKDRLEFIKHLTAANLLKAEKYRVFPNHFLFNIYNTRLNVTRSLIQNLKSLNFRDDFRILTGVVPTLGYIISDDIHETLGEILVLLNNHTKRETCIV